MTPAGACSADELAPGQILHLHCWFTKPPKWKFLVLAGYDGDRHLFFVLSTPSDYVKQRPHLLAYQVTLTPAEYGFLHHDSWLDCSKVLDDLDAADITAQLADPENGWRADLHDHTKQQIIAVVQQARTLTDWHKQLIVDGLET